MNSIFSIPLHKGRSTVRPESGGLVPKTLLVVFEDRIMNLIGSVYCLEPTAVLSECSPVTVYTLRLPDGSEIGVYQTGIGSPATAIFLERAIAKGAERVLFFGSCGGISDDAPSGTFIVPTRAFRGEGTSFYYAEPSDYIESKHSALVERLMTESGMQYIPGTVLSTDAMFRETDELLGYARSKGCIGVEMECSTLFAMSDYHSIPIAAVLYVDDTISDEWNTFSESKVLTPENISTIVGIAFRFGESADGSGNGDERLD